MAKRKYVPAIKFVCQCQNGHIFDYRGRKRLDETYYAPCEGRCPFCGSAFSLISNSKTEK